VLKIYKITKSILEHVIFIIWPPMVSGMHLNAPYRNTEHSGHIPNLMGLHIEDRHASPVIMQPMPLHD
jgi:hypothetical protein